MWPVLLLFVVVIGGIYGGIFTPTEAAAVGTAGALFFAVWLGGMRWAGMLECLYGTAEATGMIFLILLGADVLNVFLALTQMPAELAQWVGQQRTVAACSCWAPIIGIYVVLGCLMDSLSMILLTIPIFLPIVMGLDYWGLNPTDKAIWFGILALMVVEIGLITPPVGMNVYIINSLARDVPMAETFKGVVPFLISDADPRHAARLLPDPVAVARPRVDLTPGRMLSATRRPRSPGRSSPGRTGTHKRDRARAHARRCLAMDRRTPLASTTPGRRAPTAPKRRSDNRSARWR